MNGRFRSGAESNSIFQINDWVEFIIVINDKEQKFLKKLRVFTANHIYGMKHITEIWEKSKALNFTFDKNLSNILSAFPDDTR